MEPEQQAQPHTFFAPHFAVDDRWVVRDAVWEWDDERRQLLRQLGYMYLHAETGLPLRVVWWRVEQEFELDFFPEPQKIRAMDASLDEPVPERLDWVAVPLEHAQDCVPMLLAQLDRDYCEAARFIGEAPDAVEAIEAEGEERPPGEPVELVMDLDGERREFAYQLFMLALQQHHFVGERKILRAPRHGGESIL